MKKNNKKGFTLVELVIVVAVMAILVAVAIPTISSISASAQSSVNDTNARTIESMIKLAEAEADGGALSDVAVWNALTNAKLGIDKGTYVYDIEAGTVAYAAGASVETDDEGNVLTMVIEFSTGDDGITISVDAGGEDGAYTGPEEE